MPNTEHVCNVGISPKGTLLLSHLFPPWTPPWWPYFSPSHAVHVLEISPSNEEPLSD
jgi:hypothetical protein